MLFVNTYRVGLIFALCYNGNREGGLNLRELEERWHARLFGNYRNLFGRFGTPSVYNIILFVKYADLFWVHRILYGNLIQTSIRFTNRRILPFVKCTLRYKVNLLAKIPSLPYPILYY